MQYSRGPKAYGQYSGFVIKSTTFASFYVAMLLQFNIPYFTAIFHQRNAIFIAFLPQRSLAPPTQNYVRIAASVALCFLVKAAFGT